MSTLNHLLDLQQEQICYVQCGFCTTVLLVSVPFSCLSMVVTVRCGHCTGLLSVDMRSSSSFPLHLLASLNNKDEQKIEVCTEEEEAAPKPPLNKHTPSPLISSSSEDEDDDDDLVLINHIVNKPPQKRQRAPSVYNNFIKDEIRRLKAKYPNMAHKQVFSTAAKNWAHLNVRPSQENEEGESCDMKDNRDQGLQVIP